MSLLVFAKKNHGLEGQASFSLARIFLRVAFPLRAPGKPPGRKSPKNGENYKIPLPGPTPENGEKLQKLHFRSNFAPLLPHFRGSDRGGEFAIFPRFSGFPPRWLPEPSKGKSNSQGYFQKVASKILWVSSKLLAHSNRRRLLLWLLLRIVRRIRCEVGGGGGLSSANKGLPLYGAEFYTPPHPPPLKIPS